MSAQYERFLIIAVEESDSSVGFYDSFDGGEVARVDVGYWPHEIDLSPDRRVAYVTNFGVKDYDERIGNPGASISIIDVEAKCEIDRLYTFRNEDEYRRFRGPHGIKISPDGKQAYVNVETEDALLVFDLSNGDRTPAEVWLTPSALVEAHFGTDVDSLPDEFVSLPEGTHNMLFSSDGASLWVVAGIGGVTEYEVSTRRPVRGFRCAGTIRGLSYTVDNRYLIASASGEICLIDPDTLRVHKRFENVGVRQFLYSQPTSDGKYLLAPAVWEGQLLRIKVETGQVDRMLVGIDPIHVLIGPDYPARRHAYITHGRSRFISVIDWETFREVDRIACRGGPNGIAWAPFSEKPVRKALRIGACLPLSGGNIVEGQDLRLGYQYWQECVNASGGIKVGDSVYEVEMHYADSRSRTGNEQGDPQPWEKHWQERTPPEKNTIERLTEQLITDHHVQFLFGGYPSPPNLHSGRIAEEYKVPLITASGAAGMIYEQGFRHVFGIMTSAKGFLNETFRYFQTLASPPETAMFLSCDDPAAKQDAETTAEFIATELGIRIVTSKEWPSRGCNGVLLFRHGSTEFAGLAQVAQQLVPDVVAITGHLPESVAFVQEAHRRQLQPQAFVFSVGPAIPQFVDLLRDLSRHMIGTAMWSAAQNSHGHDRFVRPGIFDREFYGRFSRKPAYLAAGAMACGLALEEAMRKAGVLHPEQITLAMRDIDFESFYSRIRVNQKGLNEGRPLLTIQLGGSECDIVHVPLWPRELAREGKAMWPFPGWPDDDETVRGGHQR